MTMSVGSASELMRALRHDARGHSHLTITQHLDLRGLVPYGDGVLVVTNRTQSIQVRRMLRRCP